MINRWGSLQTFQTISAQETSWRLPLWSALVTVACVSHGHVSYRYFISEASVLEVAFYLIIQSINFRRQLFCCRPQNALISIPSFHYYMSFIHTIFLKRKSNWMAKTTGSQRLRRRHFRSQSSFKQQINRC